MKRLIQLVALSAAALGFAAQAADKEPTAQQSKMTTCNKEAGDKKGDERKAFMKNCLSAKPVAAAASGTAQQNKMKTCNADPKAKTLKGDERKKFMSECLSA
ncbi:MAG: PsiF family protein [Pseudomonadota bacterium]